ncbi:hypothetical protein ACHAXS_014378 [Conticribra weissflogii]
MADSNYNKEPVAGLSAASSCIRMTLAHPVIRSKSDDAMEAASTLSSLDKLECKRIEFRPVFTHQCFSNECIPGWRPFLDAEKESAKVYSSWKGGGDQAELEELHSSYDYCNAASPTLDVQIILSPSCHRCMIQIRTENEGNIPSETKQYDEPASKRVRFNCCDVGSDVEVESGRKHLQIHDLVKNISSALPPVEAVYVNGKVEEDIDLSKNNNSATKTETQNIIKCIDRSNTTDGYHSQPIGRVLKSYQVQIQNSTSVGKRGHDTFVLTMAHGSDPNVRAYHNEIQPLARWFIETADNVDISDEDGGFWTVLYLFREHDMPENKSNITLGTVAASSPSVSRKYYSLAGYTTLFHFNSPFRKPIPGIVVRVCQVLILPPYQRAGHGSKMLYAIHQYADTYIQEYEALTPIVEVNVEDPSPGFVALRDYVDYQRFVSLVTEKKNDGGGIAGKGTPYDFAYLTIHPITSKEYFDPISDGNLQSVASLLKITKGQSQIVHEMHKLAQLEAWKQELLNCSETANHQKKNSAIEAAETNFRLMVKRSLRTKRKEELGACLGGKEEQKALLSKWFDETLLHFRGLMGLNSHCS